VITDLHAPLYTLQCNATECTKHYCSRRRTKDRDYDLLNRFTWLQSQTIWEIGIPREEK